MYFHERIFEAADAIVTPMTGCARATDDHHCSSLAVVIRSDHTETFACLLLTWWLLLLVD